ncbi:MAG: sugar ABC transporter permease [Rhodobacteraceae bacterium]|nr:sugar ABC transporter permease [Paracoccaceae bacterium]MAY47248.1 sugar ABC transporter permease [Paracoccaceae bacterium]
MTEHTATGNSWTARGARLGLVRLPLATRNALFGAVMMAPSMLFFLLLVGYPLLQTIWISLHSMSTLTRQGDFVGLANYASLLRSEDFWNAFRNSIFWTTGSLFVQVTLGVSFALVLNGALFMRPLARALVLFPYLISTVVAVLIWQWLFNDLYGYLNFLLMNLGIVDRPVNWLGQSPNAMLSVIAIAGWKHFPFVTLAVLARLQSIPPTLYDAARIDGASAWSRFWDITLPQLKPVLAAVILLRAIWDFKDFDLIYMFTGGGPRASTETLPLMIYREVFPKLSIGSGAAVAMIMLAIMMVFFWFYARMIDREEASRK